MDTLKEIIIDYAKRYGVEIADRSATGSNIWDGKTIADHYHRSYDGKRQNFDLEFLCHEIAHWIVSPENQRLLPEYGYPSYYEDFDLLVLEQKVPTKLMLDQEEQATKLGYVIWERCSLLHKGNSNDRR